MPASESARPSGNRIITSREFANDFLELAIKVGKERGLTDAESLEIAFSLAETIGGCWYGNRNP